MTVTEDSQIPTNRDASVSPEGCELCHGRGWVVTTGTGGAGAARRCSCVRDRVLPDLQDRSGVPDRYLACRFSNFRTSAAEGVGHEQLVRALASARRYVDDFLEPDGRFTSSGLLLMGPPGVGKTHLAAGVLNELMERYRVRGRFIDFTTLVHEITATFAPGSQSSKAQLVDPIVRAEVVVLDELGAHKPTAFVLDLLYLIINQRYSQRRATLFTTNYRLEGPATHSLDRGPDGPTQLSQRIPAPLVSRLYEMARPISLDSAPDYRREIQMHQHRV